MVLGILKAYGYFIGMVRIAHASLLIRIFHERRNISTYSSHHPISYQGGGDYRGIYDRGLKRGFMGYIGLLLNAPYKIDSMVWMRYGL
jgi:hypothetical protein